jgi:hypothetical protein
MRVRRNGKFHASYLGRMSMDVVQIEPVRFLPVGPAAKLTTAMEAMRLRKLFEFVGDHFGISVQVSQTTGVSRSVAVSGRCSKPTFEHTAQRLPIKAAADCRAFDI